MLEAQILKDLQKIPGVGKAISQDLYNLNIRCINDLTGKDPEMLYEQLCLLQGKRIDRCMLYVFRCAVYFASNTSHEKQKLNWWYWKDR